MRSLSRLLLVLAMAITAGCIPLGRYPTHILEPQFKHVLDAPFGSWTFSDLRGNEEDFFIATDNQHGNINSLYVFRPNGSIISQFAMSQKFRALNSLVDPRNGSRWLIYSFNDQRRTTMNGVKYTWDVPLKREEKSFESIARTDSLINDPSREWYGQIYPDILEDIDGDGRVELVGRMLDSYRANPRGLVVYDFDSGRIKWRFDTSCNLSGVLFDDFNGDGKKEFVIANHAFKNTRAAANGFDDESGRVAVLDTNGQLLHQEKFFDGFGEVQITSVDPGVDGKRYVYAVMSTWGERNTRNAVYKLLWAGNGFVKSKTWALGTFFDRGAQTYAFHSMDGSSNWRLFLVDKGSGLVVLDEDLNPVKHSYKGFIKSIGGVDDIDQDGFKELLIYTADNHYEILDYKLRLRARLKSPFPDGEPAQIRSLRVGYGTHRMVALLSGAHVQYYRYQILPFYKLVFNFVGEYLWVITLALALLLIWAYIYVRHNWNHFYQVTRRAGLGVIAVNSKLRIIHMNDEAKELFASVPDLLPARSLQTLNPDMAKLALTFLESQDRFCQTNVEIKIHDRIRRYRVSSFRMIGRWRSIVMLVVPAHQGLDEDKILWADTARRLSHHVRRHVTNVILALPRLEDEDNDPGQRKEFLAIIREEIEKIRVFTHSFQRFTELRDCDLKLQDIIPSLEHAAARLTLPENITLIKNWKLNSVLAYIEPIRFEEALTNLLNNAVEAMPEGGILHVTVKVFPMHSSPRGPLSVLVEIEDSGIGIPAKYMDEIWKPFFTTNQSGTGIGIPESRKIIESMGGEISINSEEGVGTVVSLWLKGETDGRNQGIGG